MKHLTQAHIELKKQPQSERSIQAVFKALETDATSVGGLPYVTLSMLKQMSDVFLPEHKDSKKGLALSVATVNAAFISQAVFATLEEIKKTHDASALVRQSDLFKCADVESERIALESLLIECISGDEVSQKELGAFTSLKCSQKLLSKLSMLLCELVSSGALTADIKLLPLLNDMTKANGLWCSKLNLSSQSLTDEIGGAIGLS